MVKDAEYEADRVGIQTLARSHYDTAAMAGFFSKLQAKSRSNAANWYGETPDYLMTHPVTTTRISEAKERAEQIARAPGGFLGDAGGGDNPLLPGGLKVTGKMLDGGGTGLFDFARERLRVLRRLNFEPCPCGCNQSIAECRANNPQCKVCRSLAEKVVAEVRNKAEARK